MSNTASPAAVDQDDPLVKLFNEVLKNGWKKANKPFGTYSFIALPPEVRFTTEEEARAWARDVIRILNKTDPNVNGGKEPIHRKPGESGHLIIITNPEFGFNGAVQADGSVVYSAAYPIEQRFVEAARRELHAELREPQYQDRNIVVSLSACTFDPSPPGVDAPSWLGGKEVGENAQRIFSNKSDNLHVLRKWADHEVDGWDYTKYETFSGQYLAPDINHPDRVEARTFRLEDFGLPGVNVALGFGTCADSFRENFTGTNLIVFCGGGLWRPDILDRSQGVYVLNDIWNWLVLDDVAAGVHSFADLPTLANDRRAVDHATKVADAATRAEIQDHLKDIHTMGAGSTEATIAEILLNFIPAIDQNRLSDWYVSQDAVVFEKGILLTPSRKLPVDQFSYETAEGTRLLNAQEIASLVDKKEFDDFIDHVKKEAARLKISLPRELGELHALWNKMQQDARDSGREVPRNSYGDRVQKIMDFWTKRQNDEAVNRVQESIHIQATKKRRLGQLVSSDGMDGGDHGPKHPRGGGDGRGDAGEHGRGGRGEHGRGGGGEHDRAGGGEHRGGGGVHGRGGGGEHGRGGGGEHDRAGGGEHRGGGGVHGGGEHRGHGR